MDILNQVFSEIENNKTIRKYNDIYSTNLLEILNFESGFSWSRYFYLITKISNTPNQLRMENMYGIELLFLSARLLDDLLDKDTTLYDILSSEHIALLSTELLIEGIELLSKNSYFDYALLKEALDAEFHDYTTKLDAHSSISFYFEKIVAKSTALFQMVTNLASENNSHLNNFAIHFGTFLQIKNDIFGVLSDNYADLTLQKNSLPLIASINSIRSNDNATLLLLLSNSSSSKKTIQTKVLETGVVEFCKQLMTIEREKALFELRVFNNSLEVQEFKKYLKLETI